jgi:Protein of unknown function (DUF4197)
MQLVVNKALDGLFYEVGQQEEKIRTNPAAQVTRLLKSVFGTLGGTLHGEASDSFENHRDETNEGDPRTGRDRHPGNIARLSLKPKPNSRLDLARTSLLCPPQHKACLIGPRLRTSRRHRRRRMGGRRG